LNITLAQLVPINSAIKSPQPTGVLTPPTTNKPLSRFLTDFAIIQKLGKGGFGEVVKVIWIVFPYTEI